MSNLAPKSLAMPGKSTYLQRVRCSLAGMRLHLVVVFRLGAAFRWFLQRLHACVGATEMCIGPLWQQTSPVRPVHLWYGSHQMFNRAKLSERLGVALLEAVALHWQTDRPGPTEAALQRLLDHQQASSNVRLYMCGCVAQAGFKETIWTGLVLEHAVQTDRMQVPKRVGRGMKGQ
eukprot:353115-Chlamydomonas_euryale.AAC.9